MCPPLGSYKTIMAYKMPLCGGHPPHQFTYITANLTLAPELCLAGREHFDANDRRKKAMNRRVQYKSSSAAVLSDAISAASIEVRRTANNALATLYAEPTGTTTLENPFKAGNGKPEKLNEFEFWVDPDEYKISVRTALKNDTRIVSLLWSSKVSYDTRAELVN